jgi:hypothetical protein
MSREAALLRPCASLADQSAAQGVNAETRRTEMRGHFSQLFAIHDAIAQGDIQAAREPAVELAYLSVPVGSPIGTTAFGAAAREGARRVARETTVMGAAQATTEIIRACAGCDRTNGAIIPADVVARWRGELSGSLTDHVRAADDMLLGLPLPSRLNGTVALNVCNRRHCRPFRPARKKRSGIWRADRSGPRWILSARPSTVACTRRARIKSTKIKVHVLHPIVCGSIGSPLLQHSMGSSASRPRLASGQQLPCR